MKKKNSFARLESVVPCDLDNAFAELVEKIDIDWPEFLPMERIRQKTTVIALGLLLVVGLPALWAFHWRGISTAE